MKNNYEHVPPNFGWENGGGYYKKTVIDGKTKIEGLYLYKSCPFKFSMSSYESGRYAVRGVIRALDSEGKVLQKRGKESEDIKSRISKNERGMDQRKLQVRKEIQCIQNSDALIKTCIASAAEKLYVENKTLMEVQLEGLSNEMNITPYIAAKIHGYDYIMQCHPKASNGTVEDRAKKLQRDCSKLPSVPMRKLSNKSIKASMQHAKMGIVARKEMYDFFNYCIDYGIFDGNNPVEKPKKKKTKGKAHQIRVTRPDDLTPDEQDAFYAELGTNVTALKAAVAILASGVGQKEIVKLRWKDITFKSEKDYVIVYLESFNKLSYTHNYSRPLVPRSALILRAYYDQLVAKSKGDMSSKYVFPNGKNKNEHLTPASIIEYATRILVSIGVDYGLMGKLHQEDRKIAAARKILFNTYERNIRSVCNLEYDTGTTNFLLKKPFGSDVTADSYTSFTSELGARRIYNIFKVLRKTENNDIRYDEQCNDEDVTRVYRPSTNKQYLGLHGKIVIPPGKEIIFNCEHGFDGSYFVTNYRARKVVET